MDRTVCIECNMEAENCQCPKGGWIKCSDRLPEVKETPFSSYIVSARGPGGEAKNGVQRIIQFNNKTAQWDKAQLGFFSYCIITHWQPLPPPPE